MPHVITLGCKLQLLHSMKSDIFSSCIRWNHHHRSILSQLRRYVSAVSDIPPPNVDIEYLCHDNNLSTVETNIRNRKGVGNIHNVRELYSRWNNETDSTNRKVLYDELSREAANIPNSTHPQSPIGDESQASVVGISGQPRQFDFSPKSVVELGERGGHLRCYNTTTTSGPRTYYFLDLFAKLERALVRYTLDRAVNTGFKLISVPDIVRASVIESAGFPTKGERTQIYRLDIDNDDLCLAGTAEMSIVGYLANQCLDHSQLPLKLVSASRCFRAETSNVSEETGIYRVHQFTKVELFGVTGNESGLESSTLFDEIIEFQTSLFKDLDLHFRILNMPTQELGQPAYCKYDFETWMPAKEFWGEITSTSNCTDYQARRMHLTYRRPKSGQSISVPEPESRHCHTVNGTGCAVPRTIMAIVESHQNADGTIEIPVKLRPYMNGLSRITNTQHLPKLRWITSKKR